MTDLWMPGAAREPQSGGVTLNTSLPPRATWHITWDAVVSGVQPPMGNVSSYLKRAAYCPHLMWNPFTGEIVQYYPANVGGRALNLWNEDGAVNIQIEVYFSPGVINSGRAYNTVAETPAKGYDKILAWLDTFGIPRVWPMGAPQWQGNSRDVNIWNTKAGHYGHCNVPGNTHTDPGPMPYLGKAGTKPQPVQEDEMSFTIEELLNTKITRRGGTQKGTTTIGTILSYMDANILEAGPDAVLTKPIQRGGGVGGTTTLQSTVAWLDANFTKVLASKDPKAIAEAIPDGIAQQVVDALVERIKE